MYKWLFIEPFYGREMILYLKQRPDLTLVILQLVVLEETHVSKLYKQHAAATHSKAACLCLFSPYLED